MNQLVTVCALLPLTTTTVAAAAAAVFTKFCVAGYWCVLLINSRQCMRAVRSRARFYYSFFYSFLFWIEEISSFFSFTHSQNICKISCTWEIHRITDTRFLSKNTLFVHLYTQCKWFKLLLFRFNFHKVRIASILQPNLLLLLICLFYLYSSQ